MAAQYFVRSSRRGTAFGPPTWRISSRLQFRPDTAMLAVMEAGPGPTADLEAARQRLTIEGIKFDWLTRDAYVPPDDHPYLQFDGEE